MRAYILIEIDAGTAASVVGAVRNLDLAPTTTLLSADAVIGPFDVIALVETTTSLDELIRSVTDQIQLVEGVKRTTTCLA